MKKFIVTTTINPPTAALRAFAAKPGWTMIVVGDIKTPHEAYTEASRGEWIYLHPRQQVEMDEKLSQLIGWNCIQRRNFGLLLAYQLGADVVATVDDDNMPLPGWGEDLLVGRPISCRCWNTDLPAFDPVGVAGYPQLWHRGFPLQLVDERWRVDALIKDIATLGVDVQADFWNGDPDVDAVCRMTQRPDCEFDPKHFPFTATKIGPFNSQNTFLTRAVLPHYFLFPHVGRMDDIWPSFYVQALGYKVVWNKATVHQVRLPAQAGANPNAGGGGHFNNLKGELLGYEHNLELLQRVATDPECVWEYCPGKTRRAFEQYREHFI